MTRECQPAWRSCIQKEIEATSFREWQKHGYGKKETIKEEDGTIPFSGTFAGDITGLSADTDRESGDYEFPVLLHSKTICRW